jgi:hypothetical protein
MSDLPLEPSDATRKRRKSTTPAPDEAGIVVFLVQSETAEDSTLHFVPNTVHYFGEKRYMAADELLSLGYPERFAELTSQNLLDDLFNDTLEHGSGVEHKQRLARGNFDAFVIVCDGL